MDCTMDEHPLVQLDHSLKVWHHGGHPVHACTQGPNKKICPKIHPPR